LQTESLLAGRTALTADPTLLRNDWAWNGSAGQQVWGLGVPLIRLPFELAAQLTGAPGFPDRLGPLLALGGVAAAGLSAPRRLAGADAAGVATGGSLIIAAAVLLDPLLFGVAHTRMSVYEEAVLYLALAVLVLWRLLLAAADELTLGRGLLLGAWAGFTI